MDMINQINCILYAMLKLKVHNAHNSTINVILANYYKLHETNYIQIINTRNIFDMKGILHCH